MNLLFFDSETLKFPKADPFNPDGKLIYVGVDDGKIYSDFDIEYSGDLYRDRLGAIQKRLDQASVLVGANPKFDLLWFRRYGLRLTGKLIWDVLLVQFILNHQTTPYTSLNDVAAAWGLGQKLDIVKTEYWEKGIDTDAVPLDTLQPYLKQDVQLTKQIYYLQYAEVLKRGLLPLITLHNQDLLMLVEMEWNGNLYNIKGSRSAAAKELLTIREMKRNLNHLSPVKPRKWSTDFISLLLYGGTYKWTEKEAYIFTYKDGSTKEKMHNVIKSQELPRLCEPPKKARAKEGFWPTDEATLKKLRTKGAATKIVKALLTLREKEKLVGTYLKGFPSKIKQAGWEGNIVHTNYAQTRAVTGRLASDSPNCQNVPPAQKPYFISRFKE